MYEIRRPSGQNFFCSLSPSSGMMIMLLMMMVMAMVVIIFVCFRSRINPGTQLQLISVRTIKWKTWIQSS